MAIGRRTLLGVLSWLASGVGTAAARFEPSTRTRLPAFLDRLPPAARGVLVDDAKILLGWATDAAAVGSTTRPGDLIDRYSGFLHVPGSAAPTRLDRLMGRYRVLAAPYCRHDYYGMMLGMLDGSDAVVAVLAVNRLFRLPVILEEPGGVLVDIYANAGLLGGFRTAALDAALEFADIAAAEAGKRRVPLIATGQSQAGGTAQLQIAYLVAGLSRGNGPARDGVGFVTYNATCAARSVRHFGLDPARLPGVNFAKDLDPLVGPHSRLANTIGLQIYIHADGTAGLAARSSYLAAALHPREHFLDSFDDVSLAAALEAVTG